ncbi:hypothetical protein [Kordiimonas pumila]|uniref:Uncharacterized protein n=1 Tax=Kordiimonas pumila TaxID=2161677 RepID=A0ABV7D1V3_9PROT|nr:hypothetical protein [Kordiimonas pumila]
MTSSNQDNEDKPLVIEASWAPQDPRDKLFDDSATHSEKSMSLYRIIASFHPVMNIPVLVFDSFKQMGWVRALLLWGVIIGLITFFLYIE